MDENFFVENAFNVLGLESTASEREILKQSKDIKKFLQIDEIPEFDIDLPFSKDVRSEKNIDKASRQLSNPSEKIASFFFWFYINDSKDSKALECYRQGEIAEAIEIWNEKIESKPNDFTALRNKAVLESLVFSQKKTTKYLKSSLEDWKKLIFDDKQWAQFRKIFGLSCQDGIDVPALVDDFKNKATDFLSEFYAGIATGEEDNQIYFEYDEIFPAQHSPKVFHYLYDPLLNKMNDVAKECDKMRDLVMREEKLEYEREAQIEKLRKQADDVTDEVYSLGKNTWNKNSKITVGRDSLAESLNRVGVAVSNIVDVNTFEKFSGLMTDVFNTAGDIVSSSVSKEKIVKNIKAHNEVNRLVTERNQKKYHTQPTSTPYIPPSRTEPYNISATNDTSGAALIVAGIGVFFLAVILFGGHIEWLGGIMMVISIVSFINGVRKLK